VNLSIRSGGLTALTGSSGSGKSTLLHLIGVIDSPGTGTITSNGTVVTALCGNRLGIRDCGAG
jgi:ABC-type lipoprotein export system ATPase subunit